MVKHDAQNLTRGIHAVLFAMFDRDERIDPTAMAAQTEYCVEAGCDGITVLGLATEVLKLTFDERCRIIDIVSSALAGRLPLSVTIAGNSVTEQRQLAQYAQKSGADWLILQPPIAGNYGSAEYIDFYARVGSGSTLPLAIQNAPQYLGRALSVDDIAHLHDRCPGLVAVKSEDNALNLADLVKAAPGLDVIGGRGGQEMTDCLRAGARGFVLAPDIAPLACKIFAAWKNGETDAAERLYSAAAPAIVFSMQSLEHLIVYGKRVFARNAGLTVYDRTPSQRVSEFGLLAADRWSRTLQRHCATVTRPEER